MMKNNQWICGVLNAGQWLVALTQVNDVLEIISTVFAILSTIIIVVFKCINWWDRAKSDKKISDEELKELEEILIEAKLSSGNERSEVTKYSAAPPEVEVEIVKEDEQK